MSITKNQNGDQLTVKIVGRLDTNTAPEFQKAVEPQLPAVKSLVLDFGGVDYVSSAGLRVLLTLEQEMEEKNGTMELHNVSDVVKDIFNITGFLDILTIV